MKKKSNPQKARGNEFLVINKDLEDYRIFDLRSNKPICYKKDPLDGDLDSSMVLQEIDTIEYIVAGKKQSFDYFAPNNVGILLSMANKSFNKSSEIYSKYLQDASKKDFESPKQRIIVKTRLIYDYIEQVQASIVFGYTALEAFSNLSIPSDYEYKNETSKGIIETYDKNAIERWISLRIKIGEILTDVYKTKKIKSTKVWSKFIEFEDLRHEIIHQKSISSTGFYKTYFRENFNEICKTPEEIIKFFFEERQNKDKTDCLWPWIINAKNDFPISYDYDEKNFLLTGNIYEGKKG